MLVAEIFPVSFQRLVGWSDDQIRVSDNPPYWLIEVSMTRSLEEALTVLREVDSGTEGITEQRIATVINGWQIGVISLRDSIWKLWRIWLGPDNRCETEGFPSEFKDILSTWDEYEIDAVPAETHEATKALFSSFQDDHRREFELVSPFVSMVREE